MRNDLHAKIDALWEVPEGIRADMHWLWEEGIKAVHQPAVPVDEQTARQALMRTKSVLEGLADAHLLPER